MEIKLLTLVVISGLVLGAGSLYLSKFAFADDSWSSIQERQLQAQEKAATVYDIKYQFNNVAKSQKNWSPLGYSTTDENSTGRDLTAKAKMSLDNAMSEFDKMQVTRLSMVQNTNYAGLTSVSTDEQGRDRNAIVDKARDSSLKQALSLVSQLGSLDEQYSNMPTVKTTDESTVDRQAQIESSWDSMESKATDLVNAISKIDAEYLNLQPGPTTNENTAGRQLDAEQANALAKGIQIFEEIHAKHLAYMNSTYQGLNSVPTNEQSYDRNAKIEQARETALQNALRIYNSYYNGVGLQQSLYSH